MPIKLFVRVIQLTHSSDPRCEHEVVSISGEELRWKRSIKNFRVFESRREGEKVVTQGRASIARVSDASHGSDQVLRQRDVAFAQRKVMSFDEALELMEGGAQVGDLFLCAFQVASGKRGPVFGALLLQQLSKPKELISQVLVEFLNVKRELSSIVGPSFREIPFVGGLRQTPADPCEEERSSSEAECLRNKVLYQR